MKKPVRLGSEDGFLEEIMFNIITDELPGRKPQPGEIVAVRLANGDTRRLGKAVLLPDGKLAVCCERNRSKHIHRMSGSWGICNEVLRYFDAIQILDWNPAICSLPPLIPGVSMACICISKFKVLKRSVFWLSDTSPFGGRFSVKSRICN